MYNLRVPGGTYKGIIGECMFKLTRRYLILPKFFNKFKYFKIFSDRLSLEEKNFLNKYWFSIDALEFDYSKKPRKIVLFEIKTISNPSFCDHKPEEMIKMTLATHNIYTEAKSLGFDVKIAIVELLDNWNYEVELVDFDKCNYYVDKPKKYDLPLG